MFKAEKVASSIKPDARRDDRILERTTLEDGTKKMHNVKRLMVLAALAASGCGITVQRDLNSLKATEVAFDDMCGLQGYFDALKDTTLAPPLELSSQVISEEGGSQGGKSRYRFNSEFQLKNVKRVLQENWKRLPPEVETTTNVELEVRWSERAGLKRVVTTEEAVLQLGEKSYYLPYHVCLSELLFGEPLYETRRTFLALPSAPADSSSRPRVLDSSAPAAPTPAAGSDGKQGEGDADVPVSPVPPTPVSTPFQK